MSKPPGETAAPKPPSWIEPCIPAVVSKPPRDPTWRHEIKWDGYRICVVMALSRELNLAARDLEVPVLAQAVVAARQVWNASSRRTRSVRREVRWRWTLNVFWTAA